MDESAEGGYLARMIICRLCSVAEQDQKGILDKVHAAILSGDHEVVGSIPTVGIDG